MQDNINLSVCMIAKNEEGIIGRCIKSVQLAADEIIVNDTGSTDRTVEIAESLGVTVVQSEWKNDFSYSRNISIKDAKGKWILWLDADDVLPSDSIVALNELKKKNPDCVYSIICKNVRPDGTGTSFRQARIFPNGKNILFERSIHEQMMISALKIGFELKDTEIVVEHHGYADAKLLKEKAKRNCDLLLKEFNSGQKDPVTIIEIADSYSIMEDKDSALSWYKKFLKLEDYGHRFPDLASQALLGIGKILNEQEKYLEAESFLREGLTYSPARPDLRYSLAVNLDLSQNYEDAYNELKNIVSMDKVTLMVGVDHELSKRKSYKRMISLLNRYDSSNPEELQRVAKEILNIYSDNADMINSAGRALYYSGNLLESLKLFEKSLSLVKEGNFEAFAGLVHIYLKAGKRDVAINTVQNIKNHFSTLPAFAALCQIHSLLDVSTLDADLSDLENEIKYMKEIFPL